MAVSAHDVADELRRRFPGLDRWKLHKLLYYIQGWHLAVTGEPVFHEAVKAWEDGPVVASLWADEEYRRPRPEPQPLDPSYVQAIDYVVGRYGRHTGRELVEMTHDEDPWRTLNERYNVRAVSPVISSTAMSRWFQSDSAHAAFSADVDRLRARTDVYSLGSVPLDEDAVACLRRVLSGERILESRP